MYVCMCMVITCSKSKDQPCKYKVANQSCSWSVGQGKWIFPCPRSRQRIWPREAGLAVPSRVSLLVLRTQAESGAYSRDSSRFPPRRPLIYTSNRRRVSPEFYQVTQLHIDAVHCLESAGTVPVVFKVVPAPGAASSGVTVDQ